MPASLRTHYHNLKVAPDASDEAIRAAYRALSHKHHPDRNLDNPDAHRIMSIINRSYAVLSDPQQRREHDAWIAEQRHQAQLRAQAQAQQQRQITVASQQAVAAYRRQREAARPSPPRRYRASAWWQWLGMGALVLVLVGAGWWWQGALTAPEPVAASVGQASPGLAPNGQALPATKGYVAGYPVLRERGNNVVRVDNRGLNSGVFAQLYELRGGKLTAIRSFYIPAGESFTVSKVGDGDFSLHFQRVDNGQWQISAPWLIENSERSGQYRQIDVVL